MGTFTEQVQRIATEKELTRIKKQERERKKQEQEELKNRLRNFLEGCFEEYDIKDAKQVYFTLLKNKHKTIDECKTKATEFQENYLNEIYLQTLDKVYKIYKIQATEAERIQKEEEKEAEEEARILQALQLEKLQELERKKLYDKIDADTERLKNKQKQYERMKNLFSFMLLFNKD